MNPHQALEVAALARVTPVQRFVVNHCCTPRIDAFGPARSMLGSDYTHGVTYHPAELCSVR